MKFLVPMYVGTYVGLHFRTGPNPTIVSYNTSAVKIYNATGSLLRFENKKMFSSTLKNALAYYNAGVVAVNLKAPGTIPIKMS
jgi:hypothetical protein